MSSGSPADKPISAHSVMATGRGLVVRLLALCFLAARISGAAAHEIIDLEKANEIVAAADSATERARSASDRASKGEMLFSVGLALIEATDLLNRDSAAHSGELTLNGHILLKGLSQRNLAPHFEEPLRRYLLPRRQLEEAISLAPAASYVPRARFALVKAGFYESFAFDPFKPLHANISVIRKESSEAEALVPLLEDPDEREEAAFIHAVDLAREVRLAGKTEISSTVEAKRLVEARAALKAFAETYPDSMRAASANVILQGLEQAQR